jgi:hypothetical protein
VPASSVAAPSRGELVDDVVAVAQPQAMEYSLAMPTIRPFFASRSFSFTTGIIPKRSFCSRSNLAVSDRMKSSVFHLRPYPGARQQSEQFRRQSVEQALDDATQFVGFFLGP